jgi:tetratricopeptide (TPR) repeat protein
MDPGKGVCLKVVARQKFYLMVCLASLLVACRATMPKKSKDVLDANDVQTKTPDANVPGLDDASGLDAAAMWSPANRRANAIFQFLVAEKLFQTGDTHSAASHFEASYNLDPNSFTGAQLVRSKVLVNPKDQDGLTEARRMALLYPQDPDIRLLFGQTLLIADDIKEAEVQLKEAIQLNPRLENAYLALIRAYQEENRLPAAIDIAKKMVKANPQSAQAWSVLSRILISAKQLKDSLEPARRAWELQESNPELALIYALSLDLNKRGKDAVKLYEQLYRFNPGNQELVSRMIALYKELGNLANAVSLLDDMIENARDEVPGLRMQKVIILWEMNKNDDAFKEAQELIAQLPESDRATFVYAAALQKIGKLTEALDQFAKIQNESPLKSDALRLQAVILIELERRNDAIIILKNLCDRPDVQPLAYLLLGEVFAAGDNFREAIESIDRGLKKFPKNTRLIFARGAYLERYGNMGEAEAAMRDVIAASPNDAAALNFLGYMLVEQGRAFDEAEDLIKRAIKIQPENGAYLDSLGWLYFQKKQFKRALEVLERAVTLAGDEGVIWEHVADTHVELGDLKKARDAYEKALKCKNERRDQERIQKKYKSLVSEGG